MNEKKDRLFSFACLLTATLSYVFICKPFVGLPLGVVSIVLFFLQRKNFEANRVATIGGILGAINVGMALLILLFFGIYFGILHMNGSIDWSEIIDSIDFY
ncbi:MAG: hypothetical protein K6F30_00820 [Lachnospiraceae bacterium]|nr:hypothetical protein [Lachnospiraceae bacterium]